MPTLHHDPPRILPRFSAAREVLASLRTLPPEAHLFIHLGIPDGDRRGERELAFVVVHPDLGVVIVAVQEPGVEPAGDHWIQRQADGTALTLDTAPGADLANQHYLLLNFLKKAGLGPLPAITRVLALPCLPLKPGQSLGPDLPACRILTREKLRQPFPALREAVSGGRPWASWRALDQAAHQPMAPEPFQALLEVLIPVLLPLPPLAELMAEEGEVQDHEAQQLLDHLAHNFSQGRYRVRGAPGSGKSLLGRKVARLWAAEGRKVLVLTFTRALAMASRVAMEDLVHSRQAVVSTYQDLAVTLLEDTRALPGPVSGAAPDQALPAALARALDHVWERWDALVLDEAQHLGPDWIEPLLGLLRDPARNPVLVLEDPAQNPDLEPGRLPGQPWHLDLRLRHGAAIRRAAFQALPTCGWALPEPDPGDAALEFRPSSPNAWQRDLGQVLEDLSRDGLTPSQVLILAPRPVADLGLDPDQSLGPWQLNGAADWWEGDPNRVRLGTVSAFQGLEADAVVYLAPAYGLKDASRLRYAAISRARRRVVVLEQALEAPAQPDQAPDGPGPAQELDGPAKAALMGMLRP